MRNKLHISFIAQKHLYKPLPTFDDPKPTLLETPGFETILKWATEGRRQNAATKGRDPR